eukprot:186029-Rhodomonas_salina.1
MANPPPATMHIFVPDKVVKLPDDGLNAWRGSRADARQHFLTAARQTASAGSDHAVQECVAAHQNLGIIMNFVPIPIKRHNRSSLGPS